MTTRFVYLFFFIGLSTQSIIAQVAQSSLKIDSITPIIYTSETLVYNFEVAGNHNYYVSETGILVHNNCLQELVERWHELGDDLFRIGNKDELELIVQERLVEKLKGIKPRDYWEKVGRINSILDQEFPATGFDQARNINITRYRRMVNELIKRRNELFEETFGKGNSADALTEAADKIARKITDFNNPDHSKSTVH